MRLFRKDTKIVEILDNHDIYRYSTEKQGKSFYTELAFTSPADEDFIFTVWHNGTVKGFSDSLRDYVNDFDPDEHAEMWIPYRGTNGVPYRIRDLIQDADDIKEILTYIDKDVCSCAYGLI